jgi:outer membrane immunogenic protein
MPKRLACAVALIMFAGYSAALAADFGRPPPPPAYPGALPPPVYPIFSWTGIYVGVNGGGAFGQSNWSDPFFGTTGDFDVSGGLFGGTIGGNYQFIGTPFVVGIEGDADWANISGTTFSPSGGCQVVGCESRSDFLATIRGRAGWAWGRALLYGTAGAAFGNIQAAAGAFPFSSATEAGWTAGVGLEICILAELDRQARISVRGSWHSGLQPSELRCSWGHERLAQREHSPRWHQL